MASIKIRQGEGMVSVFDADGCGAPDEGATGRLSTNEVSEVSYEEQIDEGDTNVERNFTGRKCHTDVGSDELQNTQITLTTCGIIPALDNFLMGSNAKVRGGSTVGYGRLDLDPNAVTIVEVLVQLDANACDVGGGAAPVFGVLFPLTKNWKPNGATTINGTDLVKPGFQGKGFQNNSLDPEALPSDLAHWADVYDPDEWYTAYLFDGDDVTLPTSSSDPASFGSGS